MFNTVTVKEIQTLLGKLCKEKRKEHDLSQTELADALALSRYTIQKFESGGNATLDTVLKIARHFDLLERFYEMLLGMKEDNNIKSLY